MSKPSNTPTMHSSKIFAAKMEPFLGTPAAPMSELDKTKGALAKNDASGEPAKILKPDSPGSACAPEGRDGPRLKRKGRTAGAVTL